MRTIPLTQGKVALVDDADFERVNQFKWRAHKSRKTYYAVRWARDENGKRKLIGMHDFLLDGRADHIYGNGLDNRCSNIRLATDLQNKRAFRTKPDGCSSQYRGVYWHKQHQKWYAKINITSGKQKCLGLFDSETDAARAYDAAALVRDPVFHHLNFPK